MSPRLGKACIAAREVVSTGLKVLKGETVVSCDFSGDVNVPVYVLAVQFEIAWAMGRGTGDIVRPPLTLS